jgi:hypothetical protein
MQYELTSSNPAQQPICLPLYEWIDDQLCHNLEVDGDLERMQAQIRRLSHALSIMADRLMNARLLTTEDLEKLVNHPGWPRLPKIVSDNHP